MLALRHAICYNEHIEDIWEHRASVITKGIADAFS